MENELEHTKFNDPWKYEVRSEIQTCYCGNKYIQLCSIQSNCKECSKGYWWIILIRFKDEHRNNRN
jgi:hypothetical protein